MTTNYYLQHSDGDYFCGYRDIYVPQKAWAPTWTKTPQVGRTLDDAEDAMRTLQNEYGIGEIRIVCIAPVVQKCETLVAIAINDQGRTMAECYVVVCKSGSHAIKLVPMHGYGKITYCRRGCTERNIRRVYKGTYVRMLTMF